MDPSRRNTNAKPTRVHRYDGQSIWLSAPTNAVSSSPDYELGGFLGGGAAGVVYEAECARTKRSYAIKVNDCLLFTTVLCLCMRAISTASILQEAVNSQILCADACCTCIVHAGAEPSGLQAELYRHSELLRSAGERATLHCCSYCCWSRARAYDASAHLVAHEP
jgi:hypothetical protein